MIDRTGSGELPVPRIQPEVIRAPGIAWQGNEIHNQDLFLQNKKRMRALSRIHGHLPLYRNGPLLQPHPVHRIVPSFRQAF